MTKKELTNDLKNIQYSLNFIKDYVKKISASELKNTDNDSDITQLLMELGCEINQVAEKLGMI